MIDLSETLDIGTNFPETWKTLVREILLKFEDGAVYHHENIVGNRKYSVDLVIKIDDPCDDDFSVFPLSEEVIGRPPHPPLTAYVM